MLYWVLFIVNCIKGDSHSIISLNIEDSSSTLMSLFELETPKYACQVHKSYDATTSSMIVGSVRDRIDLSMLLDILFILNAYNQCYITYLENHIAHLFVVGTECHYC